MAGFALGPGTLRASAPEGERTGGGVRVGYGRASPAPSARGLALVTRLALRPLTPTLALAPGTRRLRFGPPLAPQGGLRCAAQTGRGEGVVWGFFETRTPRGWSRGTRREKENRSSAISGSVGRVQKSRVESHLHEGAECERKIPGPGFCVRSTALSERRTQM